MHYTNIAFCCMTDLFVLCHSPFCCKLLKFTFACPQCLINALHIVGIWQMLYEQLSQCFCSLSLAQAT